MSTNFQSSMLPNQPILRVSQLSPELQNLVSECARWELIAILGGDDAFVSSAQLLRLYKLINADPDSTPSPYSISGGPNLFPSGNEFHFSSYASLFSDDKNRKGIGNEILLQLLPTIISNNLDSKHSKYTNASEILGADVNVWSTLEGLEQALNLQRSRLNLALTSRTSMFASSANYMGSKSTLAPAISEIIHAHTPNNSIILDLMCGSGAASGAFSRHWETIASDAQGFSRLLAVVQGGGMTRDRAHQIIEKVTEKAREHFNVLERILESELGQEEEFFTTEITEDVTHRFSKWIAEYARVGNSRFPLSTSATQELIERQANSAKMPYLLFSRYYANLFFGIRQAAEIDSLRFGIDQLPEGEEKDWALGVLLCAVSVCADSYGGHFAQPRMDPSDCEKSASTIGNTIFRRSLSVTQEFAIRFLNLALESESVPHRVRKVEGPWQNALTTTKTLMEKDQPLLVYLDPPYTRDEYSRYYHVLETLVNYNYPAVSGKASVPLKGAANRFASEFSSRVQSSTEKVIVEIIKQCHKRGWQCLWSYGSSGMANVESVINATEIPSNNIELFSAKYTHKSQGKRPHKQIRENVMLFKI